jgi:multidrug efflux pump subunit AcrB
MRWHRPVPADAAETIVVRVQGQFNDLEQLRAMPIIGQGGAQFGWAISPKCGYADPANVKVRFQGEPTVALGVSMVKGGDIIALGKALTQATERIAKSLPVGVTLSRCRTSPRRWRIRSASSSRC